MNARPRIKRRSILLALMAVALLTVLSVPATSLGYRPAVREIRLPHVTITVLNEGRCDAMRIVMNVTVPRNVYGIAAGYSVDRRCHIVPDRPAPFSRSDLAASESVEQEPVQRSDENTGAAWAGLCGGGQRDYVHTSQTIEDGIFIKVGKLNTVTLRWWDGSRTWLSGCGEYYSAAAQYTYKTWNHAKGLKLLAYDKQCTETLKCATASSLWKGNFHTDWAWCNYGPFGSGSGSQNQEFSLENLGTSVGNGSARGSYTQDIPCWGTHRATKTWHDSSSNVDG